MNSSTIRAINILDEQIGWMSKNKRINEATTLKLINALNTINTEFNSVEIESEAKINSLTEINMKQKLIIRACGLTEKAINEILGFSFDYLDEYAHRFTRSDDMLPLCFPLAMDLFRTGERVAREMKTK